MRLRLISVEGIDGAGKSTLMHSLGRALGYAGYPYLVTHEPYSKEFESAINRGLLREAEALAFAADRVQHYSEIISPALAAHKFVITDRYLDSSFAYQGYGTGLDLDWIAAINRRVPPPGLTYFLDVPPQEGLKRQPKRQLFEARGQKYLDRVYAGYLKLVRAEPDRFGVLPGNLSAKELSVLAERDLLDRIEGGEFGA